MSKKHSGIIILDVALISLGTWLRTIMTGKYDEMIKSYPRLFTLVLSAAIFMLVKELLKEKSLPSRISGAVKWLSAGSFGVYLLHNLLVDLIAHRIHLYPATSFIDLFGCYIIALIGSLVFITIAASTKLTSFAFTGQSYKQACKSLNFQFLFRRRKGEKSSQTFKASA